MAVDLSKALADLYREKERIESVIASLEELQQGSATRASRRGRKSMGSEERRVVSERMKKYWATRRKSTERAAS